MVSLALKSIFLRFILPGCLLTASVVRPSVISFLYGISALVSQLVPTISSQNVSGSTKVYLLASMTVAICASFAQISFQIFATVSHFQDPKQSNSCSETFEILRQFGFEALSAVADKLNMARLLLPEIVALIATSVAYVVCAKLPSPTVTSTVIAPSGAVNEAIDDEGLTEVKASNGERSTVSNHATIDKVALFASRLADVLTALLLALAAEIYPSLPSAIYFLSFLGLLTVWASHRPIHTNSLDRFRVFVMAVSSFHLFFLYLYQVPGLFQRLPPSDLTARLLGLTQYVIGNCTSQGVLTPNLTLMWPAYVNPVLVLLLYCYCALLLRYSGSISRRRSHTNENVKPFSDLITDDNSSIHEELLGNGSEADSHRDSIDAAVRRRAHRPPQPTRVFSIGTVPLDRAEIRLIFNLCRTVAANSYVLTCLAMVAWAIIYHTWFSFILLLLSVLIWMLPHSQQICYYSSPLLVLFAQALLVIQFICGMNLTSDEFPGVAASLVTDQLGLINQFENPGCVPLFVKTFLSLPFFLTLRLFVREKIAGVDRHMPSISENGISESHMDYLRDLFNKYWIYVCYAVVLFVSVRNPVTAYNIIYMFFFVLSLLLLQVSYKVWRFTLLSYWTIITGYSVFVLLLVYTYQFKGVPEFFSKITGWDVAFMASLGLDEFADTELLQKLMTPIGYLLVVILQLKYFHKYFLLLTAVPIAEIRARKESANTAESTEWSRLRSLCGRLSHILWLLAEIHMPKLVAFMFVATAIFDIGAVNLVLVAVGVLSVTIRRFHRCFVVFGTCWSAAIVIARMIIQMVPIYNETANATCIAEEVNMNISMNETSVNKSLSEWAGFSKQPEIANYLRWYIGLFIVIAFELIANLRNKHYRQQNNQVAPAYPIVFPGATRDRADESLSSCAKFMANHIFYKFGLEISFTMTAVVVSVRMDGLAALYTSFLLCLVFMKRAHIARLWGLYLTILAVLLPLQYASRLGLPPSLCIQLPWNLPSNLALWLFLPSYTNELQPNEIFLVADFFQLLLVSCQLYVFKMENSVGPATEGGDNSEVRWQEDGILVKPNREIPVADFTGTNRSTYIDWLKDATFQYFHWVTLVVVFSAAVAGISIFAFGYLLGCFLLLWKGNDIFTSPLRRVMQKWYLLLAYCLLVMLFKVFIQLLGCVYSQMLLSNNLCWLMQLCSVVCIRDSAPLGIAASCTVMASEAKTTLDVMVMFFLLIQLRIFGSHYFQHVIKEFYAQKRLASYGASVINLLISNEISAEAAKESMVLKSLETKMKQIDSKRAAVAVAAGKQTENPKFYLDGRYSGDYYMFATEEPMKTSDPDELLIDEGKEELVKETVPSTIDEKTELNAGKASVVGNAARWCLNAFTIFVTFVTLRFNSWAINHRRVASLLAEKKKQLKLDMEVAPSVDVSSPSCLAPATFVNTDHHLTAAVEDLIGLDDNVAHLDRHHTLLGRFLISCWYLLVSRTELLCYVAVILNMIGNASVLALPLPLMAFFWGSLCIPRPSKTFWLSCITYTEAVVVVKFVCQFGFVSFNIGKEAGIIEKPFFIPRILGILKQDYFAAWDILLLMALFYHRYTLKTLGLWKDVQSQGEPNPLSNEVPLDSTHVTDKNEFELQDVAAPEESIESIVHSSDVGGPYVSSEPLAGSLGYFYSAKGFFYQLLEPEPAKRRWYRVDVYALMFLCDFVCLLICIVGFNQFGTSQAPNANVVSLLQDNRVPLPFVLLLLAQFILIIIDRALYLRHSQMGKVVFHYLLIVAVHAYVFFGLPAITEVPVVQNFPAKLWYAVKCVYFLLSAWQIRAGYPVRILGNFLTKSFGMFNKVLFQVFMAIPFLFELRTVMDWIWTDTNLTLFDYFKVEDIYAYVYKTKCARRFEEKYPQPIGEERGWISKYSAGFLIFLIIVVVLWLPLLLFSLLNAIGERSLTERCTVKLEIEGYPPLYSATAQNADLQSLEPIYNQYKSAAAASKGAQAVFGEYSYLDVQTATFAPASEVTWPISRPSREALIRELQNDNAKLFLTFSWKFTRPAKGSVNELINGGRRRLPLLAGPLRDDISRMLNLSDSDSPNSVTINFLYPIFVQVRSAGEVSPMTAIEYGLLQNRQMNVDNLELTYANVSLGFSRDVGNETGEPTPRRYWQVEMFVPFWNQSDNNSAQKQKLVMAAFVDKVFPSLLTSFTSNGIIYLYVAVVLAIGRIIRSLLTGAVSSIFIEELPNVDKILQLCLDIYLVREVRNFQLEVLLYAKLLFAYRSPKTLIQWTKLKQD